MFAIARITLTSATSWDQPDPLGLHNASQSSSSASGSTRRMSALARDWGGERNLSVADADEDDEEGDENRDSTAQQQQEAASDGDDDGSQSSHRSESAKKTPASGEQEDSRYPTELSALTQKEILLNRPLLAKKSAFKSPKATSVKQLSWEEPRRNSQVDSILEAEADEIRVGVSSLRRAKSFVDTSSAGIEIGFGVGKSLSPEPVNERLSSMEDENIVPHVPNFVLHHVTQIPFKDVAPLFLPPSDALYRAIGVLDRTLCVKTHKIGILYVAAGQKTLRDVLSNTFGSARYNRFLERMGDPVPLKDCKYYYTGGLDRKTNLDGEYGLFWKDNFTHVTYHVTTLMPNSDTDVDRNNKLRHIGNNYVNIVFNESDEAFNPHILRGQFNFITVVVTPRKSGVYHIEVLRRSGDIPPFGPITREQVTTKTALAQLVRHTALAADISVSRMVDGATQRLSNSEERLRQINAIRDTHTPKSPNKKERKDSDHRVRGRTMH